MGLHPNIERVKKFRLRQCVRCGQSFGEEGYAPTKSPFFPDGAITICNNCMDNALAENHWRWEYVDKMCQMADIPFIPKEWERLKEMNSHEVFYRYAQIFLNAEYDGIHWDDYYKAFLDLKAAGCLEDELPEVAEKKRKDLKEKWGKNYDDEALAYLDDLYRGLLATQNVSGKLQKDQAEKICKISYEIDLRIREGVDFDKLLSSYDKPPDSQVLSSAGFFCFSCSIYSSIKIGRSTFTILAVVFPVMFFNTLVNTRSIISDCL